MQDVGFAASRWIRTQAGSWRQMSFVFLAGLVQGFISHLVDAVDQVLLRSVVVLIYDLEVSRLKCGRSWLRVANDGVYVYSFEGATARVSVLHAANANIVVD